ncbi:hypothetical protein E3J79_02040 [Candidatus Dependentiae bacterium]|nr:MAG: hypothetical protein E3J79_02040 [Candidatus Dependentiae bacterium]
MSAKNLQAIVLAAGKSTRFKIEKIKLAEKICGQEMLLYITKLLEQMHISTTVIIGYQREIIKKILKNHHGDTLDFALQEHQQGTGHAILCAQQNFKNENILIINGDMPLVTEAIIKELYKKHSKTNATISFVVAHNTDPSTGTYGRVIQKNNFIEIVEARDFEGDIQEHCFINAGIYIIKRKFLEKYLSTLKDTNASHEFYITDLIRIASRNGYKVSTVSVPFDHIRGINTFKELWIAEQIKRSEIIKYYMERGVRFSLAQSVNIDLDVSIGAGTLIDCSVHLLKGTKIGKNCIIQGFSTLSNAQVGDSSIIYSHSIIYDSIIGKTAKIGPFAYIHEHVTIADNTVIGYFTVSYTHNKQQYQETITGNNSLSTPGIIKKSTTPEVRNTNNSISNSCTNSCSDLLISNYSKKFRQTKHSKNAHKQTIKDADIIVSVKKKDRVTIK